MTCRAILIKLGLEKEGATPLEWSRLLVAIFALFASAFNITFLFPFLPELVKELGYNEEEKGYYVGFIASAFFVGRAFGSNLWGYLSDKKGRRPFLMICLVLTSISTVIFGLSKSVQMAIGLRFLTGFVSGMVGLVKTILYELSDDSNQGVAMSTVALSWGSGIVLGPLIGGYLCQPADKYPSVFASDGFWAMFPFLPPCLVSAGICVIACIIVFFRLPETNSKTLEKKNGGDKINHSVEEPKKDNLFIDVEGPDLVQSRSNLARMFSVEDVSNRSSMYRWNRKMSMSEPDVRFKDSRHIDLLRQHSVQNHQIQSRVEEESENDDDDDDERDGDGRKKSCIQRCCNNIFFKLMRTRKVQLVILLYSLTSFSIIGFEETLILFASTDTYLGGLDFSTNEIGTATGLMSIPLLTLQLLIFPRLERRFGAKTTAIGCSAVLMMLLMVTPLVRLLVDNPTALWLTLFLILGPLRIMTTSTFTALSLLINNSVEPMQAGTVNGLAVLFAAIARALGPIFGGSCFAWSITNRLPYPLDINFTFIVFSVTVLVSACFNVFVPTSLNKQKKKGKEMRDLLVEDGDEETEKMKKSEV